MNKLTIPPMPTLESDAPLWPYIIRLEAWSRDLAAIAQRETALADELAEALGEAYPWIAEQPGIRMLREMGNPAVLAVLNHLEDALAKHTAARQPKHHPNCCDSTQPIGEGMCCCDRQMNKEGL